MIQDPMNAAQFRSISEGIQPETDALTAWCRQKIH